MASRSTKRLRTTAPKDGEHYLWRFGYPSCHPCLFRMFHDKPSSYWGIPMYPHFRNPPYGNTDLWEVHHQTKPRNIQCLTTKSDASWCLTQQKSNIWPIPMVVGSFAHHSTGQIIGERENQPENPMVCLLGNTMVLRRFVSSKSVTSVVKLPDLWWPGGPDVLSTVTAQ